MDGFYERYPVNYPFQITAFRTLSEYRWDKNYVFHGESHNFWEFTCVLSGTLESVKEDKVFLLQPGNMICCPPMVFHSSRCNESECHILNFTFEHAGALPGVLKEGVFYLTPSEIHELKNTFYRLQEAYLQTPGNPDAGAEAALALAAFIIRLSKQHTPDYRLSNSRSSKIYQRVVETMYTALHENLSVQEIAARSAVSTTTIKDLFRRYAAIGPKKYYSDLRGAEALRLLESGVDIDQITEMMNYSSTGYFSNSFKKQFGMPPGQYRKKHFRT